MGGQENGKGRERGGKGKGKGRGGEGKEGKERERDVPDQCHPASYAPVHGLRLDASAVEFRRRTASNFHGVEVVD